MSKFPYPIDLNNISLDRYLTNLLSALVYKAGGTLGISVADILKVQEQVLVRYPTANMDKIVLELRPRNTDMYVVPEAPPWVQSPREVRPPVRMPQAEPPRPAPTDAPPPASPRIASTLDNLSLYLKEQEREEKLREIQEQDEMEERRRVGLSPFRTIPNK